MAPAAQRDDHAGPSCDALRIARCSPLAKRGFAVLREKFPEWFFPRGIDHPVIGIDKGPLQAHGQNAPNFGFPSGHKAREKDGFCRENRTQYPRTKRHICSGAFIPNSARPEAQHGFDRIDPARHGPRSNPRDQKGLGGRCKNRLATAHNSTISAVIAAGSYSSRSLLNLIGEAREAFDDPQRPLCFHSTTQNSHPAGAKGRP